MTLFAACTDAPEEPDAAPEATQPAAQPAPSIRVSFGQPADGATVPATFHVEMEAEGVEVAPAGTMTEGTGHYHILIDTDFIPAGQIIPNDDQHRHFGTGAAEADLTLAPGVHILRLQFADGAHTALEGPQYRDEIRVTVE
jgi:hypothetical protein